MLKKKIVKKILSPKKKLPISGKRVKKLATLVIAPAPAAFWVNNGPSLRHLLDLDKFLAIITDEQFRYHTERDGNDFAKWVRHVLNDEVCARELEVAKTVTAARRAISKALKRYDV